MKGDFTRSTFQADKHYSSVRMQQGRVQIDADWNEQVDIEEHLRETGVADIVGACGVPLDPAGFGLGVTTDGADLTLSAGRLYLDGILCELEATSVRVSAFPGLDETSTYYQIRVVDLLLDGRMLEAGQWIELSGGSLTAQQFKIAAVDEENRLLSFAAAQATAISAFSSESDAAVTRVTTFLTQPHYPEPPASSTFDDSQTWIAYLDVWRQHVTSLEDETIREVALRGPDTATRVRTIWQLKLLGIDQAPANVSCTGDLTAWDDLTRGSTGRMRARAEPEETSSDPCIVPPSAGYRGLENQLYRVEIHEGGSLSTATFKWSRENGSVVTSWLSTSGSTITVSSIGRDDNLSIAVGDWIELLDDTCELMRVPGTLVPVLAVEGTTITLDTTQATGSYDIGDFPLNPRVRRWDMSDGAIPLEGGGTADADGWVPLEDGVEVKFETGTFRTGDFWMIPARTVTADIEWPNDGAEPQAAHGPSGIVHHYCRLARLVYSGGSWTVLSDCRPKFPALTELKSLYYVRGDGQETMPTVLLLPQPLQVGVSNGQWPVEGATVEFTIVAGGGTLQGDDDPGSTIYVQTDANGIASANWTLGAYSPSNLTQRVTARLVDDEHQPLHLPIKFTARFSLANKVWYDSTNCAMLAAAEADTVQEAIDALCEALHDDPGTHVSAVALLNQAGGTAPLANDSYVDFKALNYGVRITCTVDDPSATLDPGCFNARPTCVLELELPVTYQQLESNQVAYYQRVVLAGTASSSGNVITWTPAAATVTWINDVLSQVVADMQDASRGSRVLVHLLLKGELIWATTASGTKYYLDGEAFGTMRANGSGMDVTLPSGDGHEGGDFRMWFWLNGTPQIQVIPQTLDFGQVVVGQSASLNLTIENQGQVQLTTTLNIVDSSHQFTFTGGVQTLTNFTVPAGGNEVIAVIFTPSSTGPKSANLQITSNDPDTPLVNVALQGAGTQGQGLTGSLAVKPEKLDFGRVPIGKTVTRRVTLYNPGNAPATVLDVAIQDESGQFKLGGSLVSYPLELAAGDTLPLTVQFKPAKAGAQKALFVARRKGTDETARCALVGSGERQEG